MTIILTIFLAQVGLYVLSGLLARALLWRTWYRAYRDGRSDPAYYPLLIAEAKRTRLGRLDFAVFCLARWWQIIPGHFVGWLRKRGKDA